MLTIHVASRQLVILALLIAVLFAPGAGLTARAGSADASHTRLARVAFVDRGLAVQAPHGKWVQGRVKMALFNRYLLETKVDQRASIGFKDGTTLHLNQQTDVVLASPHSTLLRRGEVDEQLAPGTSHRIQTAAAVASAIGTNFDVEVEGSTTSVVVLHGAVTVKNKQGNVLVKAGQGTSLEPGEAPAPPKPVDAGAATSWTAALPTPDLGENLALDANGGKVIGTSSESPGSNGNGAARAINDGRLDTEWETAPGQATNQWVKIALPGTKLYDLSALLISPGTGTGPAGAAIKDFELKVSTRGPDDSDFSTALTGTLQPKTALQRFTLGGVRARYVELVGRTTAGNATRLTVAEVEVVGKPSMAPLFRFPGGVAVDSHGRVYVSEGSTREIHVFSHSGSLLTSIGDPSQLQGPAGVAADSTGTIFVVDHPSDRIVTFSSTGAPLPTWGTPGSGPGQFFDPEGIAIDGQGNVYVADYQNNRIQKFSSSGAFLLQWGSAGRGATQFALPTGVAVDTQGNVFVADMGNNRISKFSPSGALLGQWGTAGSGPGQFKGPRAVAVDASGAMYVADTGNDRVQKLSSSGQPLAQWGSHGTGHGQFSGPNGIAVDGQGNIYVTDVRLQKFSPSGDFLQEWR